MNELKAQERTVYWNIDVEKRNKRRRLWLKWQRRLVGLCLVGVSVTMLTLLLIWSYGIENTVSIFFGIGFVGAMLYGFFRGLESLN